MIRVTSMATPLAGFPPGSVVLVTGTAADAPAAVVRRLEDLGFTAGSQVEVVRRAPLRDPTIYRVRDYDVCLRRDQAAYLLARELDG
ncbi:FeoA family protein [Nucisporomicrobium flavum]|uniref:FeoA family protein n=1 Tax=Nucisporomicrobium flavum TaxID=2785915 RepID=UPI0027DD0B3B|nr:FeoA family protein [Nucisporomicrobium flavum]